MLSFPQLIEKMSINPGRIIDRMNRIQAGYDANLTILDLEKTYTVNAEQFKSMSRNTPFDQWEMKGKVVLTMVNGKIIFEDF